MAAVERLAKADRRLAATVDQWDANPWVLGTPGGVIDLRTGKVRLSAPTDYMTKITAVVPDGECPRGTNSSPASQEATPIAGVSKTVVWVRA